MIVAQHDFQEHATARTTYEVKCDKCGAVHDDPAIMPDTSVLHAQLSGWDVATIFPGESFQAQRVRCPRCKR